MVRVIIASLMLTTAAFGQVKTQKTQELLQRIRALEYENAVLIRQIEKLQKKDALPPKRTKQFTELEEPEGIEGILAIQADLNKLKGELNSHEEELKSDLKSIHELESLVRKQGDVHRIKGKVYTRDQVLKWLHALTMKRDTKKQHARSIQEVAAHLQKKLDDQSGKSTRQNKRRVLNKEFLERVARQQKEYFDFLVKAGFTPDQALEIIKDATMFE